MMFAREFQLSAGSRFGALVAGALLLVVLGVFLAFGFVLLLGLVAVGLLLGLAAAISRKLSGRSAAPVVHRGHGLDPRLEVLPPKAVLDEPRPTREKGPLL